MKTFEIYWNDLTDDAKERLKDLNHDNVDLSPLAIIELDDDDDELLKDMVEHPEKYMQ